jgi:hypothetical protein
VRDGIPFNSDMKFRHVFSFPLLLSSSLSSHVKMRQAWCNSSFGVCVFVWVFLSPSLCPRGEGGRGRVIACVIRVTFLGCGFRVRLRTCGCELVHCAMFHAYKRVCGCHFLSLARALARSCSLYPLPFSPTLPSYPSSSISHGHVSGLF